MKMKHLLASLLTVAAVTPAMAISIPSAPPVLVDFAEWNEPDFKSNFTIQNVNADNETFKWNPAGQNSHKANCVVMYYSLVSNADDWVITTSPIALQAGKVYTLTAKASGYNPNKGYEETVGVYIGSTPDHSSMTAVVQPRLIATKFDVPEELTNTFTVPTSGDYYVGFRCTTPVKDGFWCTYHGFQLTSNDNKAQPSTPAAPTLVAKADGTAEVAVTATVPSVDAIGNAVTDPTTMRFYRNGSKIGELVDCQPGAEVVFTDNSTTGLTEGVQMYQVEAVNANGNSPLSSTSTVFVGVNIPGSPVNPTVKAGATDGQIVISWEAPEADYMGYPLNGPVTYDVYANPEGEILAGNLTATTFTYTAANATDVQKLFRFRIYAKNAKGKSQRPADTGYMPAGKTLKAPYAESFANGAAADVFEYVNTGNGSFKLANTGYEAQDGDKGVAVFTARAAGDKAELRSALIEVPANGLLTFFYNGTEAGNNDRLELLVDAGEGFNSVATFDLTSGAWTMGSYDMAALAGKKIRYGFAATYNNGKTVLVDNITLAARAAKDVAVTEINAPASVNFATDATVSTVITNMGTDKADNVLVEMLVNGKQAESKTVSVEAGKTATVEFTLNVRDSSSPTVSVEVKATLEGDANTANNSSVSGAIEVKIPNLPTVEDLAGQLNDNTVVLTWSRPSFEGFEPDPVTEGFENAKSLSSEVAGWTFDNRNSSPRAATTTVGGHSFDGVSSTEGGFFVLDATGLHENFAPYAGKKVLCSLPKADGSARNEWIFSPELDGSEQRISFKAHALVTRSLVSIAVYEQDPETGVYTMLQSNFVPGIWANISFLVNEGVRHFAIQCTSNENAELLIDDINFRPSVAGAGLDIEGYNVYCDNNKLNNELVTDESFTHADVPDGDHEYYVTAVSNTGVESAYSNFFVCTVNKNSIAGMTAEQFVVSVNGHVITVSAPADAAVQIVAMDGRVVYTGMGNARMSVTPGIYAVSVAGKTTKVVVR